MKAKPDKLAGRIPAQPPAARVMELEALDRSSGHVLSGKVGDLVASMSLIRTIFNQLKDLADRMHADIGVTASMRAVMETLSEQGQMTVPQVAALKGVTRQHIQTLTDVLIGRGFVTMEQNPRHLRSVLLGLTKKGRETFAVMSAREAKLIGALSKNFAPEGQVQLRRSLEVLAANVRELAAEQDAKGKR